MTLVAVAYRNEHGAFLRQLIAHGELRFRISLGVRARDAHDLARRFHLGAQHHIRAREAAPRHNGFLHAEVIHAAIVGRQVQAFDAAAAHDERGALRQRHTGRLRHERHRAARARVRLDDVNRLALNGVLHVDQAAHAQAQRQAARDVAQLADQTIAERERRNARGRVARVNAGFLNMLEHAAHVYLLAVAQRIHIAFDGSFEETVQIHRMIRRDTRCLGHEGAQVRRVVGDFHAAAAKHVARANKQREANAVGDAFGFLEARGHAGSGVRNVELVEHGAEAFAIFGQVNRLGARAHNGHARFLQRMRELQRRLAAERHHDAVGLLDIDDVHNVFVGERLEIQAVARVVVGGHGFGVAVHHDGFVAGLVQRIARMHAAVVELNALADAVGTRAQNHGLGFVDGHDFGIAEARRRAGRRNMGRFVSFVMVFGFARELGRARVDRFERGHDAQALAVSAHDDFFRAREVCDLRIGETVLLRDAHSQRIEVFQAQAVELILHGSHIGDAMQEPRVDAAGLMHVFHAPATAQSLSHIEDAVFRGARHAFGEMLFVEIILAVGAQASAAVLQRTHSLAERFLKRAADAHDFTHGLHARGKRGIGALEFFERKARHFHHAIVDGRLEARRRDARDVVRDFVERVAHGQARGGFRDRETGRL